MPAASRAPPTRGERRNRYLEKKGGDVKALEGWTTGHNARGDTTFQDPGSGRVFRSKPEVARFLGVLGAKALPDGPGRE